MSPNHSRAFLLSSAVLWLLGVVFLFLALSTRASSGGTEGFIPWGRRHDVAVALASLSIAAAAWSLREVTASKGGIVGNAAAWLGTICGIATALLLALVFLTGASDMLYMLPQGGIGLWLIALCAKKPVGFGIGTRVLGFVAGAGLLLIAVSFVMIALALGPALVTLVDARSLGANPAGVASPLNAWGHLVLNVGSLLGVPTYPLWAWLASRALQRAAFST
jgi:hypothetical protein